MFHLHVGYRSRDGGGSCESARQYIAREGPFAKRGDRVRWVRSIHMPGWADGDSAPAYWRAAEGPHSRVNARTAVLIEFAVPRQLPLEDQNALVMSMSEALSAMGEEDPATLLRLSLTVAFHEGHGRNPHAHVMLSLSLNDGLARDEKTWFRRYSAKSPGQGGARRSDYVTKRRWLYRVRETWSRLANAALGRLGLEPALDHRSHVQRSLTTKPQIHLGPRISHMARQGIATSRGDRHAAIAAENSAMHELEAVLLRRKRAVQIAELEDAVSLQAERVWARQRDLFWVDMLRDHPLADEQELCSHASAVVFESAPDGLKIAHHTFERQADTRQLAQLVGPDWDTVATSAGHWAVRPYQDEVILMGRGYLATDGNDETSVTAMLKASTFVKFKRPALLARDGLKDLAKRVLEGLGFDWPMGTLQRADKKLTKRF